MFGPNHQTGPELAYDPTPGWTKESRCQGDWLLFDSTLEPNSRVRTNAVEELQALCADCPVRTQCLIRGLSTNAQGVWGGIELSTRKKTNLASTDPSDQAA